MSSKDGILVRDAGSGREMRSLGAGEYSVLSYSPDGRTLAAQGLNPGRLELWDVSSGHQLSLQQAMPAPPSSLFSFLGFGDSGKTLIAGGSPFLRVPPHADNHFHFWEVATGKEQRHFSVGPGNLWKIALSPDGTVLALGFYGEDGPENRIALWDTATGKLVRTLVGKTHKPVSTSKLYFNALEFTPDGNSLLAGGIDDTLLLFDVKTGQETCRLGKNIRNPDVAAISPDGKTVAVQIARTAIRLLDLATGVERLPRNGPEWPIHQMQATQDGRTIVTAESNSILVWDSTTGQVSHRLQAGLDFVAAMRMTRNGRKLIAMCADLDFRRRALHVWELPSGKELRVIPLSDRDAGYVTLLAVAADGKTLAYAGSGGAIVVLDVNTAKELRRLTGHAALSLGAEFTADGRTLVVWCGDQVIHRWDLGTGQETTRSFAQPPPRAGMMQPPPPAVPRGGLIYHAALAPDGRTIALATQTNRITILDFVDGKLRDLENLPENTMIVSFSPDGKALAWGGQGSGNVHLVECSTGRERHCFTGQRGGIESLAFSGDGKVLVSGSDDTTTVLWDLTGRVAGKEHGKALSGADLDRYAADLAGEDANRAFKAIQTLAAAPAQSVPYLGRLVAPVAAVDGQRLNRLVTDLDSDRFAVRNQASAELQKLAELAVPILKKTLKANPSLETRQRIHSLLTRVEQEQLSPSSERIRGIRTIEILERIDTADSRHLLEAYAQGAPGARLTAEAKAALQRHGTDTSAH